MQASYILGQSNHAELRLELLNELTTPNFIQAIGLLPKRNVRVLIIGCGSGHLEEVLSRQFFNSKFVGIDISANRIEEAKARTQGLPNTYEYIQADLTQLNPENLGKFDILISRFVLSHLPNPKEVLGKFLPLAGYVWYEELASDCKEYYCNIENKGYQTFTQIVPLQIKTQNSSFNTGVELLSDAVIYKRLSQAILDTPRRKSILRLGIEDGKAVLVNHMKENEINETIKSLHEFEEDKSAIGYYTRSIIVVMGSFREFG